MQINKVTSYPQNKQPSFKAVNQKYFEWAKKDFSLTKNVSGDWLQMLSFDFFLFKNISKQDAIDTVEATIKYMKKSDWGTEDLLNRLKNYPY